MTSPVLGGRSTVTRAAILTALFLGIFTIILFFVDLFVDDDPSNSWRVACVVAGLVILAGAYLFNRDPRAVLVGAVLCLAVTWWTIIGALLAIAVIVLSLISWNQRNRAIAR